MTKPTTTEKKKGTLTMEDMQKAFKDSLKYNHEGIYLTLGLGQRLMLDSLRTHSAWLKLLHSRLDSMPAEIRGVEVKEKC